MNGGGNQQILNANLLEIIREREEKKLQSPTRKIV
jgi:hypothetical protein